METPAQKANKIALGRTWYDPFKPNLEIYPILLKEQLRMEKNINTPGMRRKLNCALFEDASRYSYYYDPVQYKAIIHGICEAYPYLKGSRNEEGEYPHAADSKVSLKNSFQIYVHKQRRNLRDIPVVAQQRHRYVAGRNKGKHITFTDDKPNVYGIQNFCPARFPGESDESIAAHVIAMQHIAMQLPIWRKENIIEHLMDKTFPERRAGITKTGKTLAELYTEYPLLFDMDGITKEYGRLMGGTNPYHQLMNGLGAIEEKVVGLKAYGKATTDEEDYKKKLFEAIQVEANPERKSYLKKVLSVFIIINKLGTKVDDLFLHPNDNSSNPKIKVVGGEEFDILADHPQEFKIIIEGLAKSGHFMEALAMTFASYNIFNIVIGGELKGFNFSTRYIYKIDDSTLMDKTLANLWSKLM